MIWAWFYVCASLYGGEVVSCTPETASEPPRRVYVFERDCGAYPYSGHLARIDCGTLL